MFLMLHVHPFDIKDYLGTYMYSKYVPTSGTVLQSTKHPPTYVGTVHAKVGTYLPTHVLLQHWLALLYLSLMFLDKCNDSQNDFPKPEAFCFLGWLAGIAPVSQLRGRFYQGHGRLQQLQKHHISKNAIMDCLYRNTQLIKTICTVAAITYSIQLVILRMRSPIQKFSSIIFKNLSKRCIVNRHVLNMSEQGMSTLRTGGSPL